MTKDNSGFVYVMAKESSPNYLKIGRTEKKPQLRADELDSTDSPTPSFVVYYVFCEDCYSLEQLVHSELTEYRVRKNREWFTCSSQHAVHTINLIANKNDILIHYEKFLVESIDNNSSDSTEIKDIEIEKDKIEEAIDSIFHCGDYYITELRKYKKYYDERINQLKSHMSHNVASDKSFAKTVYRHKVKELLENYDININSVLDSVRKDELGEVVVSKLQKLADDIKNGVIEPVIPSDDSYLKKIKKEESANSYIEKLFKKIYLN